MLALLTGTIVDISDDHLIVDTHGVGYEVFVPQRLLTSLVVGQTARIPVMTHVREDQLMLFGFSSMIEKKWFRVLTSVQGVGNKMALSLLDHLPPAQLANAIAADDIHTLRQADGVGPKLAKRLVTELRDKVATLPTDDTPMPQHMSLKPANQQIPPTSSGEKVIEAPPAMDPNLNDASAPITTEQLGVSPQLSRDAVSALSNLGYSQSEAFQVMATLQREWLQKHAKDINLDSLIKEGLARLAQTAQNSGAHR